MQMFHVDENVCFATKQKDFSQILDLGFKCP
jgi:hypothetical protein